MFLGKQFQHFFECVVQRWAEEGLGSIINHRAQRSHHNVNIYEYISELVLHVEELVNASV